MFTDAGHRTLHTQSEYMRRPLFYNNRTPQVYKHADEDYATNERISQFHIDNHFCITNEVLFAEWAYEECVGVAGSDDYNIPQ